MYHYRSCVLLLLSFFLLLTPSLAKSFCRHDAHCDDGDPTTYDYCFRSHRTCIHLPDSRSVVSSRQDGIPGLELRSFSDLRDELNDKPLSLSEKKTIVGAARRIMAELNPHLFLQLNLLKYDVVAELDTFEERLDLLQRIQTNFDFHSAMQRIFSGMNDRHSVYVVPKPFTSTIAFLGFFVGEFFVEGDTCDNGLPRRRYSVAGLLEPLLSDKILNSTFEEGSEILTWDGLPIDTVVRALGRDSYGSNFAAQISNGVQLLSLRTLAIDLPPLNSTVSIGYTTRAGVRGTIEIPWMFIQIEDEETGMAMARGYSSWRGRPFSTAPVITPERIKVSSPRDASERSPPTIPEAVRIPEENFTTIPVDANFSALFEAELVKTTVGQIGLLTVPSFNSSVTTELVTELSRVLKLMPPLGLILDLRGNTGGNPDYVKVLVELTSNVTVEEQPLTLRATNTTRDFFEDPALLSDISPEDTEQYSSFRHAVRTAQLVGEALTGPVTGLYSNETDIRRPQVYKGPAVTVVDGLTYSGGDLFAAIQVDQNGSLLVGTSDNVGAGGAATARYSLLQSLAPNTFEPLPGGVDFTTSILRFYRSGPQAGAIVENFGVKPQVRYYPTLNDTVDDCDLLEFLARKLVHGH